VNLRALGIAVTVSLGASVCSCVDQHGSAGAPGGDRGVLNPEPMHAELKAGELPEWWIAEPRAVGRMVTVSASGAAPEASVARDLAVRNARAAARAVLGAEPVRVVVSRETSARARTGDFEAFVLARCDAAGASALLGGGGSAGANDAGGAEAESAPSGERAAAVAPQTKAVPADNAAPPGSGVSKPAAPAESNEVPVWWFEDIRRDGASARACAKAEGPRLLETRRSAVDAAKERLKAQGVTGAVQTLFIATRRPEGIGYRVYVMGQGEVGK